MPFDAGQCEQRHEHEHDDDRRVEDAGAHFLARLGDHSQRRQGRRTRAILAQAPQDVLDADDGVVDQLADRDREASQRHRIDRQIEQSEDDDGDEHGHRNRHQRNEGRAHVHQEQEQHHADDQQRFEQDAFDIADRGFDEAGLAELHLQGGDAGRQGFLRGFEGRLDFAGQQHGVHAGLLLHPQHHGRLPLVAGAAAPCPRRIADLGDGAEQDRHAIARRHHEARERCRITFAAERADHELLRTLVDETAAAIRGEAAHGGFDVIERDVELTHPGRIRRDTILAHLSTDRDHLRNARNRQQPRPKIEFGDFAQQHRIGFFPSECHQHDLAHDRGDRADRSLNIRRQLVLHR